MTTRRAFGGGRRAVAVAGDQMPLPPGPAPPAAEPDPIRAARAQRENEHDELAVMADRERIAFDLHDLVIQRLFAAGLALQSTAGISEDPQIARRLDHVIDELDATIVDIRGTIFALGHRHDGGSADLRDRILDLATDAASTLGHKPRIRFTGPIATAVPDAVAEHLLAVLREALSNVARHAQATTTTVHVSLAGNLVLQVTDNGVGTGGAAPISGLRNMGRRAESLGGGTEVTIPAGGGTCVNWWVPIIPGSRPQKVEA